MPIRFSCAKCEANFTVPDTAAGKTAKCKSCGQPIKIPNQSTVQAKPAAKANPVTKANPAAKAKSAAKPKAMYEITSGINGSVFGPADRKTLEQWVTEDRITPTCKIKQVGTEKWVLASRVFSSLREAAPEPEVADSGFPGVGATAGVGAVAGGGNPFAGIEKKKSGNASIAVNPYASASAQREMVSVSGEVRPRSGSIGLIINHAFKRYGEEFGTLLGGTVMFLVCAIGLMGAFAGILWAIGGAMVYGGGIRTQAAAESAGIVIGVIAVVLYFIMIAVFTYLGIGMMRLILKIGRGENANVTDVFDSGGRFLPVLGFGLMTGLAVGLIQGVILVAAQAAMGPSGPGGPPMVVGLVLMLLLLIFSLAFWPCYFLVVDGKAKVFAAYSLGLKIGFKNLLQSFVIFLIAGVVYVAGALLLGIGIIFSLPLAMLIVAVAYLNMSGQIPAQG